MANRRGALASWLATARPAVANKSLNGRKLRVGEFCKSEEPGRSMLLPVYVRMLWGRVGSTLLMQLLATSNEIAFARRYPFEDRVLSSLLYYLHPILGTPRLPCGWWMDDPNSLWWVDPAMAFPFSVNGDPLPFPDLGVDRAAFHREAVRSVWAAYTKSYNASNGGRARFYAEKYGAFVEDIVSAGITPRYIDLVRDPRDVWASVHAFDEKRGYYGFGRQEGQPEADFLDSFIAACQRRLDAMNTGGATSSTLLVRYEDLVSDLAGQADRLARWLGVGLDVAGLAQPGAALAHHTTTRSPADSVARWRQDLPLADAARITAQLHAYLVRLGYPT